MNDELINRLSQIVGDDRIKYEEPMKNHTTFRIGGPAQVYVTPESAEQIQEVVSLCREVDEPLYVIGNGSNILVNDDGIRGVVMALFTQYADYKIEDNMITAQSGISLIRLSALAAEAGLSGLEFASGIPGSLGGGIYMNAGAYGGQMADVVSEVTVLDSDGKVKTLSGSGLAFGYRQSAIQDGDMIVLQAVLKLEYGDREAIRSRINELAESRRQKQPLEYPSAGSTFKRPEGYYAGKLIADAGLKGCSVGGAQVSEKHAGFVINKGGATAKDVIELTDYIRDKIYRENNVTLELEVRKLGW